MLSVLLKSSFIPLRDRCNMYINSNRLVALSHVLSIGTPYEVPNSISGKLLLRPLIRGEQGRGK
jgi:hypothetical protein